MEKTILSKDYYRQELHIRAQGCGLVEAADVTAEQKMQSWEAIKRRLEARRREKGAVREIDPAQCIWFMRLVRSAERLARLTAWDIDITAYGSHAAITLVGEHMLITDEGCELEQAAIYRLFKSCSDIYFNTINRYGHPCIMLQFTFDMDNDIDRPEEE